VKGSTAGGTDGGVVGAGSAKGTVGLGSWGGVGIEEIGGVGGVGGATGMFGGVEMLGLLNGFGAEVITSKSRLAVSLARVFPEIGFWLLSMGIN